MSQRVIITLESLANGKVSDLRPFLKAALRRGRWRCIEIRSADSIVVRSPGVPETIQGAASHG